MTWKLNIREYFRIHRRILKYLCIILILLSVDQLLKLLVYKTFIPHEESKIVGEWFRIRLELNDGIAFSKPFRNETDRYVKILIKFILSIILILCLIYYLNKRSPRILLIGMAFCFSGSMGNLIDRMLHGVLLNNSLEIYTTEWLHGRVIDMLYFPLFEINLPYWFPYRGGEEYLFFEPVFNIADLLLFIGGIMSFLGLILYGRLKST